MARSRRGGRPAASRASTGIMAMAVGAGATIAALLRARRELTGQVASRDSELLTILDGLPIAVMLRAGDGTLLHINPAGERMILRFGVDVAHVRPSPRSLLDHIEVIHEDGRPYEAAQLPVVSAVRDGRSREATLGYALPGGGYAWYAIRAAPVRLGDGTSGTVVTCDDVTERHEARNEVVVAERSLRRMFDQAPIGIAVISPTGELLRVNGALCQLLGYEATDLLAAGLDGVVHADERAHHAQQLRTWLAATEEQYLVDRRFLSAGGRTVFTQLCVAAVRSDDGTRLHLIVQVVDISERRALEQELRAAAREDPLTGLANRRALAEHLLEAQQHRTRAGGEIGLLYLDLDRFKAVNDTYGHDVGDSVLIGAAQRLLAVTRSVDTVCRLGGDEFVVLCAPIAGPQGMQELVDRLSAMAMLSVCVGGVPVTVDCSMGAILVEPGEDLDGALRRADAAMYRAKRGETCA